MPAERCGKCSVLSYSAKRAALLVDQKLQVTKKLCPGCLLDVRDAFQETDTSWRRPA